MSTTGKSGSRRAFVVMFVIILGAGGGFWVGKDRFFGPGAPAGPEVRGNGGGASETATFEPQIPAPDEIPANIHGKM